MCNTKKNPAQDQFCEFLIMGFFGGKWAIKIQNLREVPI